MPNSLNVVANLSNSTLQLDHTGNATVTTTGDAFQGGQISVGTSEETITVSTDIGNAGLMWIQNTDDTNFVSFGFATTVYPLILNPGEAYLMRLTAATATLYLKADTAACNVHFGIYED